ncbi:zinc-binding alcohol dehydrogenase family protein [Pseudooceanicola sp. CBS1P-1]|uniref:Zinc-binding dehydrogenase n=1 Tax=Pseudooceanicola albus TaxID=2692189 RepID=A0A6L7G500_9RHOB|nr:MULTISPECIES: zinc-binding alcohol dehydrogenase family protein [Pseudooceanicola]MBT9386149.1 zinc-binding alcohol dehydrogenase family protein [Pseudooceanicola endophyticus]MXN19434.1 zinc-binding dehydrogenase [Pseudooceanicola albus]
MNTLVATRFGTPPDMRLQSRERPAPRPGHSLVRIHAATANPLSHQVRTGKVTGATAPLVLGNEAAGRVESGARFAPGTPVAIFGGGQLGITGDGLQQQWALVEDKRLIALPPEYDLTVAAALPVNYATAHQAMTRVGQVSPGQKVLISGASGALGHALTQIALMLGAEPIALVSSTAKVARARQSGAQTVIDLSAGALPAQVARATGGLGADLAFDTVGGPVLGAMLTALRARGTAVSIGFAGGTSAAIDLPDLVVHEKRLLGYDLWLESDAAIAATFATLAAGISDGRLKPSIDSTWPLADHARAYERLLSRQAMGAVVLTL